MIDNLKLSPSHPEAADNRSLKNVKLEKIKEVVIIKLKIDFASDPPCPP
ncbi:hypothetical protein C789_2391 [Microcystis aeruginosa FACHB-905 = DIANCHI905]|uniref:Uncharacterized protein n=1 Tax=Microcystis aeruginosa PCC 7806SL TaxID=1903187 RepID=A0AB33BWM3_MICA7|nr:hypothetical protein BH695_4501 [Microcystis aeruginosa PCC 7806SL]ELS47829.1 hypothetical protein C789_2391 [Microcystis aeruginosa FACHB-905 = DIANCHI905]